MCDESLPDLDHAAHLGAVWLSCWRYPKPPRLVATYSASTAAPPRLRRSDEGAAFGREAIQEGLHVRALAVSPFHLDAVHRRG